jgi:hypothetical protein
MRTAETPSSLDADQPEKCWEEEKRLNCALRAFFGARSDGCPFGQSIKVNLEYEQLGQQ